MSYQFVIMNNNPIDKVDLVNNTLAKADEVSFL